MAKKKIILGVVGHALSGKDTVGEYLKEKYGFSHVSTGALVRNHIAENNLGIPTRDLMIKVANNLRKEHGGDILVRWAIGQQEESVVINGIRAIPEAEAIKISGGYIIACHASSEIRFQRTIKRGRASDNISYNEFLRQEKLESKNKIVHAQNINRLIEIADHTVKNEKEVEVLFKKLDEIMLEILNKKKTSSDLFN